MSDQIGRLASRHSVKTDCLVCWSNCNFIFPLYILQGRNPFYVEPAMVICITDGSRLSTQGGIQEEVFQFLNHKKMYIHHGLQIKNKAKAEVILCVELDIQSICFCAIPNYMCCKNWQIGEVFSANTFFPCELKACI